MVETGQLDLSSNESIKDFVKRAEGSKRLDAIIENVGLLVMHYAKVKMVNVVLNLL